MIPQFIDLFDLRQFKHSTRIEGDLLPFDSVITYRFHSSLGISFNSAPHCVNERRDAVGQSTSELFRNRTHRAQRIWIYVKRKPTTTVRRRNAVNNRPYQFGNLFIAEKNALYSLYARECFSGSRSVGVVCRKIVLQAEERMIRIYPPPSHLSK